MKSKAIISIISAVFLALPVCSVGIARADGLADATEESVKAAETLREIMGIPEKSIPKEVLDDAHCVAVFPSTIKGGFIIGARKGDGVVSCRTASGWSDPLFLDLSGGSIGPQIGGQSTDYVFLFLNRSGVDQLLKNKLSLGGEVSVAAGPVGREAGASTDWKLNAQILSYSRSKGLFAGAELKGVAISIDDSDMKAVYGAGASPNDVLSGKTRGPEGIKAFPKGLARLAPGTHDAHSSK
jgi:lipid-binding SYLF domain-containing protein